MEFHCLRLTPGQEIKGALTEFVKRKKLRSAFIVTCCGSVRSATLRYAEKPDGAEKKVETHDEHYEICSLVGTLTSDGGSHLHTVLSDQSGRTVGGHVVGDLVVFTTAEVVLGSSESIGFTRQYDENTGYNELVISVDQDCQ